MTCYDLTEKISGIYMILFPNGKIYIGRAIDVKRRIIEHYKKDDDTPCQKALRKFYKQPYDIEFIILERIFEYDYKTICKLEKKWIKLYSSNVKEIGYNLTSGGDGADHGISNSAPKFSKDDLTSIIDLLKEGKSNREISLLYNVHEDTIGRINQGRTYFDLEIDYPIRKDKEKIEYSNRYNSYSNEQLDEAIDLLTNSKMTYSEITKKTSVLKYTLTNLNTGKHPYCKKLNINFPIRKSRRSVPFKEEDVDSIKRDLLDKTLSIEDIAKKHFCERSTVSDINQGKRYFKDNEKYPIRNFYPQRKTKKPVSTISGSGE